MNPISPELPLLAPTSIDDLRMQGHSTLRMPQKADTGIEIFGQDQRLENRQTVLRDEHLLGAAQSQTSSAKQT